MEQNGIKPNKVMVDIGSYFKRLTLLQKQQTYSKFFNSAKIDAEDDFSNSRISTPLLQKNNGV